MSNKSMKNDELNNSGLLHRCNAFLQCTREAESEYDLIADVVKYLRQQANTPPSAVADQELVVKSFLASVLNDPEKIRSIQLASGGTKKAKLTETIKIINELINMAAINKSEGA